MHQRMLAPQKLNDFRLALRLGPILMFSDLDARVQTGVELIFLQPATEMCVLSRLKKSKRLTILASHVFFFLGAD